MKPSAKSLIPSLLMLYLPILLVGGIGLSEIRSVEEELQSFSKNAIPLLDGAGKEFGYELDTTLLKAFVSLEDGMESKAIIDQLRQIPVQSEGSSAIRFAFLLPGDIRIRRGRRPLRPVYPKSGTTRRMFRNTRLASISPQLVLRVRQSNQLGWVSGPKQAIEHLEQHKTKISKATEEAYLDFHLGAWLGRAEEWGRASETLKKGREALEQSDQTDFFLYPDLLLAELRSSSRLAKQMNKPGSFQAHERELLIHRLIGGMALGEFDSESRQLLNSYMERALRYAAPLLDANKEFASEVRDYLVQHRLREDFRTETRAILRHLQALSEGRRLDIQKLMQAQGGILTLPYSQATGTCMLALKSITAVEPDNRKTHYLVGLLIDLASLLAPKIRELELRLATLGNSYRVELLGEDGRSILDSIRTPLNAQSRRKASSLATKRPLGGRFKGFSLLALPEDPQSIMAAGRMRVWMRIAALLALLITAFGAAYLFMRTVRKEQEFADLRTSFVARVSHELKTPLSLIRMYGETLAMGRVPDPEKASHFAGIIAQESDRLSRMIDNVLDFSQIDLGVKNYSRKELRLDQHIENLLESYAHHLKSQGFDLQSHPMPPLQARVDPEALTQALVNLIGNAQKYSPEKGDKKIEVQLSRVRQEAWIEVLDRGVGVPEAERKRIFETFYRAKTSEERRGAGLGLALVKHFAQYHGGSVECLERPGGGSIFRLRLPLASAAATPVEPQEDQQPSASYQEQDGNQRQDPRRR